MSDIIDINVVNVCGPASPFILDFFFSSFNIPSFLIFIWSLPSPFFLLKLLSYLIHWKAQSYRPADGVHKSDAGFSYLYRSCSFAGTPVVNETAGCFDPTLSCPHGTLLTIVWLYATLLKANSGFLLRNVQKYLRSPSVVKGRLRGPNDLMCEIAISIW